MNSNQVTAYQSGRPGDVLAVNAGMIEDFIEFLDVKPKTLETYRRALKQFFVYLNVNGITQPERDDIINYRNTIIAGHKATTTQAYINAVKRFFSFTDLMGIYPDITKGVKNARVERGTYRKDYFNGDQLSQILETLEQDTTPEGIRNIALFRLTVTGALRTIEIERAHIEDLKTRGGHTVLYVQGKGRDGKDTPVIVSGKTERALRAYLATRPEAKGT